MIIDALVSFFVGIFEGVLSLIPDWAPDFSALRTGFSDVVGAVQMFNGYFPVDVLIVSVGVVLAVRVAVVVWHGLIFVWDKLPFKAT